ncbi:MAG: hypothetical protein H0T75_18700 [Rhizobiales bacterium]|nr:hypothetical protein [Hyphomicrobiales bacterium]
MAGYWSGRLYYGDATNETVHGTGIDEVIYGDQGDDSLFGEGGNDYVDGGFGSDTVDGGEGNDVLSDFASGSFSPGIVGRDTLHGGAGDDELRFFSPDTGDFAYGDDGTDTIRLDFSAATSTQRVTFRLAPNTVVKLNDANTVGVSSIERVIFLGGQGDDFVIGGELDDALISGFGGYGSGNDGNDTLRGMAGDDTIDGGSGIQQIDGGADNDRASFDVSGAGAVAFRIVSGARINLGTCIGTGPDRGCRSPSTGCVPQPPSPHGRRIAYSLRTRRPSDAKADPLRTKDSQAPRRPPLRRARERASKQGPVSTGDALIPSAAGCGGRSRAPRQAPERPRPS